MKTSRIGIEVPIRDSELRPRRKMTPDGSRFVVHQSRDICRMEVLPKNSC